MKMARAICSQRNTNRAAFAVPCLMLLLALVLSLFGLRGLAQDAPSRTIDADTTQFAIAPDNSIAFSIAKLKHFDKITIERDEVWVSSPKGKFKQVIDPDKFMPVPPPTTYVIQSIAWSPDSQRLSLSMLSKTFPWEPKVKGKKRGQLDDDDIDNTYDDNANVASAAGGGNVIALLDQDGHEIKVANSKTRFIQGGLSGTWLADGKTFVYVNGNGQIMRVTPDDGKSSTLYDQKRFEAIGWDAARNRAFAIGEGLTGRLTLFQLGLLDETVAEITPIDQFKGNSLTVSATGKAVGFFSDGDTIETINLADPSKPIHVHTGPGRFEFDHDDRRILIKRGMQGQSNDLVWVRLDDGNFSPILHDLLYHDFHIAPDGSSVGVVDVGKGILRIYPLEQ
jgi:hypothetical protein